MYSCVLFDLFETLVTERDVAPVRASSLGAQMGLDEERFRAEWKRRRLDVVAGGYSFRGALAGTAAALGSAIPEAVLESICAERRREKAAVLQSVERSVLATLEELRSRGLALGVVSNCIAEDVAAWPESPLRPCFDVTVFSCTVGLAKPDPRIYRLACEEARVEPPRALFVGDGEVELEGAERAGLCAHRALWFLAGWPHVVLSPEEPGLRSISDVLTILDGKAA